jgi:hypothetical protein
MRPLSYILISRKTADFLWPSLSNEQQHPGHLQGRLYVHCEELLVGRNSLQVPTITLTHDGETKTVIKKLPDDSSEDRCFFP